VLGVLGVMGVRSAGHKIRDGDFCDHVNPATDSLAATSTEYGGQPQQTSKHSISVPPDCFLQ
jgi:hypothetical protein